MLGPGKYDDACTVVRESLRAKGAIIVVLDGVQGNGFSAQLTEPDMKAMPGILRDIAKEIEAGAKQMKDAPPAEAPVAP